MDIPSSNVTIDDLVIDNMALSEAIRKSFTRDPFEHYVNGVCGLLICFLGIISNALSLSVLLRRTMRVSTYVYLAGLCFSDFTTCLFLIPGHILDAYPVDVSDFELPRTYAYTKLLVISGAISTTARVLSVWLCVAFTIDRWIMICRPFAGPIYCTIKNARLVTLIIYIVGVFYAVPLMLEYEPHEERSLSEILFFNRNKKIYRYKLSKLGSHSVFRWIYVLINALGVYVIPLTIIILLNRKLFISIRLLKRRSLESNAPFPAKQGVTIMLLATTIMLLVFRSPSATISVMWLISAKMFIHEKPPFPLRKFHSIANLCATLNAATTFIMFLIYGTKFRSEFTRLHCFLVNKFKKPTTITAIRQGLIVNDNKNDHELHTNTITNKSNGNIYQKLPRHDSSATTSPSGTSFSPTRHLEKQQNKPQFSFDQDYELMMIHKNNIHTNCPQSEVTIRENECNGDHNDPKRILLTESCFGWFKNFIGCH